MSVQARAEAIGRQLIGEDDSEEDARQEYIDDLARQHTEYMDGARGRRNLAAQHYSVQRERPLNTRGVEGSVFTDDELIDGRDVSGYVDFVWRRVHYAGTFSLDAELDSREDEFDLERPDEVDYDEEDTGQGFDDDDYSQVSEDLGEAIRDALR